MLDSFCVFSFVPYIPRLNLEQVRMSRITSFSLFPLGSCSCPQAQANKSHISNDIISKTMRTGISVCEYKLEERTGKKLWRYILGSLAYATVRPIWICDTVRHIIMVLWVLPPKHIRVIYRCARSRRRNKISSAAAAAHAASLCGRLPIHLRGRSTAYALSFQFHRGWETWCDTTLKKKEKEKRAGKTGTHKNCIVWALSFRISSSATIQYDSSSVAFSWKMMPD